jgi:hypothetical protein
MYMDSPALVVVTNKHFTLEKTLMKLCIHVPL